MYCKAHGGLKVCGHMTSWSVGGERAGTRETILWEIQNGGLLLRFEDLL